MPNPKTITIAVVGIKDDGALELAVGVNAGDSVNWVVMPGSGVLSIDGIIDSSSTVNIFDGELVADPPPSNPPGNPNRPGKHSKKWSGKVSKDIGVQVIETYSINYTKDDGSEGMHDPKIITNP